MAVWQVARISPTRLLDVLRYTWSVHQLNAQAFQQM